MREITVNTHVGKQKSQLTFLKRGKSDCASPKEKNRVPISRNVRFLYSFFSFRKPFTYALCLNEIGADIVQRFIGREPSGRSFNEIALDYNGKRDLTRSP